MAAIHEVITHGLGTPSSIPYFLTLGLGIGVPSGPTPYADVVMTARSEDVVVELQVDDYVVSVPSSDEVHEG